MNIYKKEYTGTFGGGMMLIAAYTSEQADEIVSKAKPWISDLDPAVKLENCRCYNKESGIIVSNYYIE